MKNIIFFGIGDVGDAVMKTTILKATRQYLPQASIHILLGSWNAELLRNHPCIDKIYCYNYPWSNLYYGLNRNWMYQIYFLLFSQLLRELKQQIFDAAICFSMGKMDRLLMLFLHSKMKIGYAGLWNDYFLTHSVSTIQERIITEIETGLSLLKPLGINADYCLPQLQLDDSDRIELDRFLNKRDILDKKIITICPGVGGSANKQWLPEYFAEVADVLAEQRENIIVISGSPRETVIVNEVQKNMKNKAIINYGGLSLRGFAALIERSNLVICNASAPMHMAAAFGRPAVVLNGGFNDQIQALKWGYKVNNIVMLTADIGSRPADYWHPVCKGHICMREIKPDFVLEEAQRLLSSSDKAGLIGHVNSRVISANMRCGSYR